MRHTKRWAVGLLLIVVAGLALAACAGLPGESASGGASASAEPPAQVEPIEGADVSRVILSEEAAKRLDIQTAPLRDEQVRGALRTVVPYSAVIYDVHGETWVYTGSERLTFVRAPIQIDFIDGDLAVLSEGPPSGTAIVTVGAPELYGAEFGVGE